MCEDEGLYRQHPSYNGHNLKEICKFHKLITKTARMILLTGFIVLGVISLNPIVNPAGGLIVWCIATSFIMAPSKCCDDL